jgi:hypothetical protein
MTVQQYSGHANDHTLGLIATSKHQSNWRGQHKPRMDWVSDPAHLGVDEGGPEFQQYLQSRLGFDSNRLVRGSTQFTGHTALLIRWMGNVRWSKGFVPQPGVSTYYQALIAGGECVGMWRDDRAMIRDPTCISVEFKVPPYLFPEFIRYWESVKDDYTHYSFQVGAHGHCNCVWAAVEVLRGFATQKGLPFVDRLGKVQDPKQGHMMQMIMSGELLID